MFDRRSYTVSYRSKNRTVTLEAADFLRECEVHLTEWDWTGCDN